MQKYEGEYTYEYNLDIVNIKLKKNYTYNESVDFDTGVFLDFDKNYCPLNLEIFSASKRMDVKKEYLINPEGKVNICINDDLIELEVDLTNNNEKHLLKYDNRHPENLKMKNCEISFILN